ncbi:DUF4402 domain-containing protein [Parasphingorhabdus halotolerans]|uniref:DUF4402 domain-containing protein n=1 Tax=Parasphingorhabdus halotolerans TaxID=2725558 RepID=A0A6H2DK98_9SPHN|nr:DUF4402 domain-containing protein [Parasphingorhabdus halotolerans]
MVRSGGPETMIVTNFILDGNAIRLLPLFTSLGNFKDGGRLNVGANQVGGAYSGNFTVTVNYL